MPLDTPHFLQAVFVTPFCVPQFLQVHAVVVPQPQVEQLMAPIGKALPQLGQRVCGVGLGVGLGVGVGVGIGVGIGEGLLFPQTLHTMVSLIVSQSGQVQVAVGGGFKPEDIFSGIVFLLNLQHLSQYGQTLPRANSRFRQALVLLRLSQILFRLYVPRHRSNISRIVPSPCCLLLTYADIRTQPRTRIASPPNAISPKPFVPLPAFFDFNTPDSALISMNAPVTASNIHKFSI